LTVRPTSAVRRYLNEDTDALTAAQQLAADAVLEGSVQRAGDRLRVSVNLLRTGDGVSLWTESFDMRMTDIFVIQDTVSQQVATRLRLQLDPEQKARLAKRTTSNPIAYEFYVKGVYSFDQRGFGAAAKRQIDATIDLFKKAIEAEPKYALAHARLAHVYVWKALFIVPDEQAVWAELGKEEIKRAETLDLQLAETHVARSWLLFSGYEGYQTEAAARELLSAQQLDPNVGHGDLAGSYYHLGLEDLAEREYQRALEIDPTSEFVKNQFAIFYMLVNRWDEYLTVSQKYFSDQPVYPFYFIVKGRLDEAQRSIDDLAAKQPDSPDLPDLKAMLFAVKGEHRAAEALIPEILKNTNRQRPDYHHSTYNIACIYALAGKSDEAVKWLRETVATGFSDYPLFERDPFLDRIRQSPKFIQFMAEMKEQNERYKREFA